MNNLKKSYTTSYILNNNAVFGNNINTSNNKSSTINCMNYQVIDNISEINNIVYKNIQNGGMICDYKIRSNMNSKLYDRLKDESLSIIPPFKYNVDTEYYLLHGDSSSCTKHWKDRHLKS